MKCLIFKEIKNIFTFSFSDSQSLHKFSYKVITKRVISSEIVHAQLTLRNRVLCEHIVRHIYTIDTRLGGSQKYVWLVSPADPTLCALENKIKSLLPKPLL